MNSLRVTQKEGALLLLTPAELRDILGCSRSHLYKLRHGKFPEMPPLPLIPFGHSYRVRRDALVAWLLLLEKKPK